MVCDTAKPLPIEFSAAFHPVGCADAHPVSGAAARGDWFPFPRIGHRVGYRGTAASDPDAVDPERIRRCTAGMEFSMAALFLVIFTDQMKGFFRHGR